MEDPIIRREYEADQEALWAEVIRIKQIIEGPPHPGLDRRVATFIDSYEAVEVERDRVQTQRHEENKATAERMELRLQLWGFVISVLALAAVGIQIWQAVHSLR